MHFSVRPSSETQHIHVLLARNSTGYYSCIHQAIVNQAKGFRFRAHYFACLLRSRYGEREEAIRSIADVDLRRPILVTWLLLNWLLSGFSTPGDIKVAISVLLQLWELGSSGTGLLDQVYTLIFLLQVHESKGVVTFLVYFMKPL